MNNAKILYAECKDQFVIKIIGEIRHTISSGLDRVINYGFNKTNAKYFIIDLSETTYIDSTNLGLLAKIAKLARINNYANPTIVSCNEDVNIVLKSMGFEMIFYFIEKLEKNFDCFQSVNIHDQETEKTKWIILEAHKTLMEINKKNNNQFHSVVELLSKEI